MMLGTIIIGIIITINHQYLFHQHVVNTIVHPNVQVLVVHTLVILHANAINAQIVSLCFFNLNNFSISVLL